MQVFRPNDLLHALALKATHHDAQPIAGGTDVMVEVNLGHARPPALIDLSHVPELDVIRREDGKVYVGAGVTFARLMRELDDLGPMLQAARTIGSPQIRQRATLGGNLGTASPAGDALAVLAAYDADVEVASASRGRRRLTWNQFLVGPKHTALEPDELIVGTTWRVISGRGSFSKIGPRSAMVIAVVALCLVLDRERREVRVALGSVGPTVLRANTAEAFVNAALAHTERLTNHDAAVFSELVAEAARPIDDVRGAADYRLHACKVLAHRALAWALEPQPGC